MACAAVAASAPAAGAATVSHDLTGGTVTYNAATREANRLVVGGDGTLVQLSDAVAINAPLLLAPSINDCTSTGTSASCPIATTTINLGDGPDTVTTSAGAPALNINAGAGNDILVDPVVTPRTTFDGGSGVDTADYSARAEALDLSLDNAANDGAPGEGDDIVVGDILISGAGNDILRGNANANALTGGAGNDNLTGGGGKDTLNGGAGDDTIIAANDGVADTVDCGAGNDAVAADRGVGGITDTLLNCENVTGQLPPPPAPPAAPPVTTSTGTPTPAPPAPTSTPASTPAGSTAATTTTTGPATTLGSAAGITPVAAPGVASPRDLTPPSATLRALARQRMRTVLLRGVPLTVSCAEACGISISLSVDRTTARRLRLSAPLGPAVVGTAIARRSTAGASIYRVKLSKKAQRALRRTRRRVKVTAQVLVSDASGNATLLQRPLTLVR